MTGRKLIRDLVPVNDGGRMWYDRAQRLKRERDDALAEAERLRALVADG